MLNAGLNCFFGFLAVFCAKKDWGVYLGSFYKIFWANILILIFFFKDVFKLKNLKNFRFFRTAPVKKGDPTNFLSYRGKKKRGFPKRSGFFFVGLEGCPGFGRCFFGASENKDGGLFSAGNGS